MLFISTHVMAPHFVIMKILGGAAILFLPGWLWSKVCWPGNQLDPLARSGLAVGLSFATIALTVYLLTLAGILPGRMFFLLALAVATLLPTLLLLWARGYAHRKRNAIPDNT